MSGVDLARAFLSGVVTGVPTSVRAKGFRSKPDDNKATQRPAVGGHGRSPPRRTPGSGRTMRARGKPGWSAAMTGEFRVEERKTGRGERICAVMSDAGAVVRFVRTRTSPAGAASA